MSPMVWNRLKSSYDESEFIKSKEMYSIYQDLMPAVFARSQKVNKKVKSMKNNKQKPVATYDGIVSEYLYIKNGYTKYTYSIDRKNLIEFVSEFKKVKTKILKTKHPMKFPPAVLLLGPFLTKYCKFVKLVFPFLGSLPMKESFNDSAKYQINFMPFYKLLATSNKDKMELLDVFSNFLKSFFGLLNYITEYTDRKDCFKCKNLEGIPGVKDMHTCIYMLDYYEQFRKRKNDFDQVTAKRQFKKATIKHPSRTHWLYQLQIDCSDFEPIPDNARKRYSDDIAIKLKA